MNIFQVLVHFSLKFDMKIYFVLEKYVQLKFPFGLLPAPSHPGLVRLLR